MGQDSALTKATAGQAAAVALSQLRAVPTFQQQEHAEGIERPGIPPGARSRFNPGGGDAWGAAPMHELVSAEGTSQGRAARGTPQSDGPAWGRVATVDKGNPVGVIRVYVDDPTDFVLTLDTEIEPVATTNVAIYQGVFIWAYVTYGSGAASIQRTIRVDPWIDIPLCGAYVDVRCYLGDGLGGTFDPGIFTSLTPGKVVAMLSKGNRALPYTPSIFVPAGLIIPAADIVHAGVRFNEGGRMLSMQAHLTGAAAGDRFLQLFDSTTSNPPAHNDSPYAEFALGTTPTASAIGGPGAGRFLNPLPFTQGVYWAVSTTSGVFTASTDSAVVQFEMQSM